MSIKRAFPLLFLFLTALPAAAGSLYPMECGDLRRSNKSLSPSPLQNPLKVQWITLPCLDLGYPISNPIILSDQVVQTFRYGVRCFDRTTGARIWSWACNRKTEIFNAPSYDAGRGLLYLGCVNGDTLALTAQTGDVAWYYPHKPSSYPSQFSSPLFAEGKLFVGNGGTGFLCLDPDTRATLWEFDFGTALGISGYVGANTTPAYDNGSIYLCVGSGELFSLNASSGAVQWHVKQKFSNYICPLLSDEYIYTMGMMSQVECRSRTDGSLVWAADTHTVVGQTSGNLALCGDMLIVPGDSWVVWALNRFTGAKCWSTKLTGNFARNTPLIVCGKIYISACHGDFYSLDGQTGKIEWRLFHGDDVTFVGWAEADGQLFVGMRTGKMLCFTSVTPGDPANCVSNLLPTPVADTTLPIPTPMFLSYPTCPTTPTSTPTMTHTPTPTLSPTGTLTPVNSPTPTNSPTPFPTVVYVNPDTEVAVDLSVPVATVDEAREEGLDPTTTYVLILLAKHCGCHPHDLTSLRLTMTWDEIATLYGTTWSALTTEALSLTSGLAVEGTPTATASPTPTPSLTPANTLTATLSRTPTNTPTTTITPTSTASPTLTPELVCHPVPYPNPSYGDPIKFNVGGGPYDEIRVNVYTTSFRKVCGRKHICGNLVQENVVWDLKDDYGASMADGLYYVEIETHQRGVVKKHISKCLILK